MAKFGRFRLRVPTGVELKPTRAELLALGAWVAILAEAGWLAFLLWRGEPVFDLVNDVRWPLILAGVPLAIFALLPRSLMVWTRAGIVALSRESGNLGGVDNGVLILALTSTAWLAYRRGVPHWPAVLILLANCAVVLVILRMQERIDYTRHRHPVFTPPDFLTGPDEAETLIDPDPGASKVFDFCKTADGHRVGVSIPPDLLQSMRELNAARNGYLYQEEPLAVLLGDRDPAKGLGREELLRMGRQMTSIVRSHDQTAYEFANAVLSFVQLRFQYAFDADSTTGMIGGPFDEYGRFWLETFHDGVGDCDCTSILAASLLAQCGFDCALLFVSFDDPLTGERCNHVAVGLVPEGIFRNEAIVAGFTLVKTPGGGPQYLYGETAIDGATLAFGSSPPEWDPMEIRRVVHIPAVPSSGR